MSDFKPDFGIWAKENIPAADVHMFYDIFIKDIMRISEREYSLFTNYSFGGIDYALSLDFPYELLEPLLRSISLFFGPEDILAIYGQLTDPQLRYRIVEWSEPVGGINCTAVLGRRQANNNESYMPLVIQEFF